MSQGGNANKNGKRFETRIAEILDELGIEYIKQHRYDSIYGHRAQMDFYLPTLDLAIEAKNQEGAGSVAEKIPYVMESFEQHPANHGLLVFGGAYWPTRPGIRDWAVSRATRSAKQINIIYESDLRGYLEQTKTRCAA